MTPFDSWTGALRRELDGTRTIARHVMWLFLLVASLLAGVGATSPDMWGLVALLVGAVAASVLLLLYPKAALIVSFFLVIAAATKFRDREATALLAGDLDAQVIFELASYAVIMLAVLVNVLLISSRRHGRALRLTPLEILLGGYVFLAAASTVWSVDARVTAARVMQLLILYGLCLVAVRVLRPQQALRTLTLFVAGYVGLAALLALLFPWARHTGPFFSWFAVHPGVAGTFAGTAGILMLSGALFGEGSGDRGIPRSLAWLAIVPLVLVVLATHERSPLFAFTAAALTLGIRKRLPPRAAAAALVVALVVSAWSLQQIASVAAVTKVGPAQENPVVVYLLRGQSGEQFLSLSGRVELWAYVSALVHERPLLGYGYLASRSMLLDRFPWAGTAHSALPEVLLNLGIVGVVLLGLLVGWGVLSAFLRTPPGGKFGTGGQGAILGALVYLVVLSVAGESIAGAPNYEVFLFFLAIVTYGHLHEAGSVR